MILFKGKIKKREPIITAQIDEKGNLNLSSKGQHRFIVDTGFTGDIAVPITLLPKLNLSFASYSRFVLATKKVIRVPVFRGWVYIKGKRLKVEIVPGDELLGMGLLEKIGSKLIVDFDHAEVKIIG
jgi:predicted aspartyl protease